jgi:hypothetical protein
VEPRHHGALPGATDPRQLFDVAHPSGSLTQIIHRGSGRCVAPRDCYFTFMLDGRKELPYAQIVADRCDAVSSCSHWTGVADPAAPEFSRCSSPSTRPSGQALGHSSP